MPMLTRPSWVNFGSADRRQLRYLWDDALADDDYTGDASAVLGAALKMAVRARMALAIGLYEWIVWRFEGLHRRVEPEQIVEAAWCAAVDPHYLKHYEFPREEWIGPVEGPLWCAMTYLHHGLPKGYVLEGDLYDAIELLYLLAAHVVPDADYFHDWLGVTLRRLVERHPVQPIDLFEDLFEHRIGEQLGELIGRDTLDPGAEVDVGRDRRFLTQVLAVARDSENPFLASPDDLEEAGFEGEPYSLPPESNVGH